jgi:hypothetical protein
MVDCELVVGHDPAVEDDEPEAIDLREPTNLAQPMIDFQKLLVSGLTERFTNDKEMGEYVVNETTGRRRNIVTVNVFSHKTLILATLLDPRLKDFPFASAGD